MRFDQTYLGSSPDIDCAPFAATMPGSIQKDYIDAHPEFISDINYGMQHKRMIELEPYTWYYTTELAYSLQDNEKLWFVTEGIDYIWTLVADGEEFYTHEGMFSKVELCLSDLLGEKLHPGMKFAIKIHPHPMLEGMPTDRNQASQCVKPPVAYEWDWHPRAIPSGLWDDTYFESRTNAHLDRAEVRYELADDFASAHVTVDLVSEAPADFTFTAPDGSLVYEKKGVTAPFAFDIASPELWWCHNLGKPALYSWKMVTSENAICGHTGFRRIRLVMNEGAWDEPIEFPKTRSYPPAQFELNGVKVFAKGTNYVNQEIFTGIMNEERYEELIVMAVEANMNIFRCWGGSGIQKDCFYDLCDRYGMMVWVEFPLACNNYYDSKPYLRVLEQEATAIVLKLRKHASIALWCGGNELFNNWSLMTDQHLALRLLNSITFRMVPEIPYNPTSPLSGMKHGGYTFIDRLTGKDQFALFSSSRGTAYTEFGVPGIPSVEFIKSCIPEDELFPIKEGGAWEAHHAFNAWGADAWLCLDTLTRFGDTSSLEGVVATSQWIQAVGYKAIFEEARRQKPYCAMAINWCWCEPWKCAVNNSLIAYPNIKKSGYFTVRDSLRNVTGSLRMPRFDFKPGSEFTCEGFLLNDSNAQASGKLHVWVELEGKTYELGEEELNAQPLTNAKGKTYAFTVPEGTANKAHMLVHADLLTEGGVIENSYEMVVLK